ncbi:MAG: family 10 glycosylhydrolase [Ignavibacteriales bacterium]|nr:family 10 glycosylhydrolase [Ignavibacteriales bacterium]
MNYILKYLILFLLSTLLLAQLPRETRAVWIATNYRLDWPSVALDPETQKKDLENIFDNLKKKKFNTVYFQVRHNGSVLFKSSYEPYAQFIIRPTDSISIYDPLNYAIDLARKKGIEIHAWINVFNCLASGNEDLLQSSKHVMNRNPEWIIKNFRDNATTYWLDPGLPEVRAYLINIIEELVKNYDIDGIHFDYLRYPGMNFDDNYSYTVYGDGMNKSDWRRENLNKFVESLYTKIRQLNSTIKIGVAPIGIYKNIDGARGMESFYEVYQDTRKWLQKGWIDYVVPQLYWDFQSNPKFDVIAKDWLNNSFGKSLVLGLGAYRKEIQPQLEDMIKFARANNADGVAFYRYSDVKNFNTDLYKYVSLPSRMSCLIQDNPNAPDNFHYSIIDDKINRIKLSWSKPDLTNLEYDIRYYSLYRLNKPEDKPSERNFIDFIQGKSNSITFSISQPPRVTIYFAIKSIDKIWNESETSTSILKFTIPNLEKLSSRLFYLEKPMLINQGYDEYLLILFSTGKDFANLSIDERGIQKTITDCELKKGYNFIKISEDLKKYKYLNIFLGSTKTTFNLEVK